MTETQQRRAETLERRGCIVIRGRKPAREQSFERTVILARPSHDPKQRRQVPAGVETMVEAAQAAGIFCGIEGSDRLGR